MKRAVVVASVVAGIALACGERASVPKPCTDAWFRAVEAKVGTGDGAGHGPDLGSDEWKSTVEFRLGIRGNTNVPPRDDPAWCTHVDRLVVEHAPSP
jgi:hypothetical protein